MLALRQTRNARSVRAWSFAPTSGQEVRSVPESIRGMVFTRISVDPSRCGGVPCIRDLRIPVATVVSMVAEGQTHEEIVAELPELELEDIREALRYAAEAVRERELPLISHGLSRDSIMSTKRDQGRRRASERGARPGSTTTAAGVRAPPVRCQPRPSTHGDGGCQAR